MKKIKRLRHLQKQRQRLHHRRTELEAAIRNDWQEIRQSLKPANLAKEALSASTSWIRKLFFAGKD